MTNRRDLLKTAMLATLGATLLRGGSAAAGGASADDIFLNRLTFGATPDDRALLAEIGQTAWLDHQLALPADDAGLSARLGQQMLRIAYEAGDNGEGGTWPAVDELRPLAALSADPATLLPLVDWSRAMAWPERVRPADEVIAAALTRAVHAPAQLREVMTQFWHDHFNVHALKDEFVAIHFPAHDAALRADALGNFRALLGAVARSPAMLQYLGNADSRASPANENYARELLELHTLGAPHYLNHLHRRWHEVPQGPDGVAVGFIDEDVFEVARAFTGWTIGDGRWISEGVEAPRSGRFHYATAWHDPYQKRVLGVEFPPNRAAMEDGEQVLDMLARHPGTALFVCTKIARRLLADDPPPDLIGALQAVFLAQSGAPDQIAQVIRALVAHPAFGATPPVKLRRPFEFLAALYRGSGAAVTGHESSYHWQLTRAGWMQHTFPPPTGHPDRAADWTAGTAVLRLIDFAQYGHDPWFGVTETRLSSLVPPGLSRLGELTAFWAERLHGRPDDNLHDALVAVGLAPDDPLPADEGSLHDLSVLAVGFAALTPQFLYR